MPYKISDYSINVEEEVQNRYDLTFFNDVQENAMCQSEIDTHLPSISQSECLLYIYS